ncbi:hypothetical protein [Streptomyces sp. NBC_00724]|uniref:hypothetical protein n=1 Tax=Streptomyces sp. NBC_00724 TaxID=2975812 RepID=UPI002ED44C78|nr:hypothetical protein OHB17_13465 [Streptomyces sp. NBC_00724]
MFLTGNHHHLAYCCGTLLALAGIGDVGKGRDRRIRRARSFGAAATAFLAVVAVVGFGAKAGLPWWAVVAGALLTAGLAGWTGAQIGRQHGIRNEVLEPGETVVGTYTVRPPYAEHTPPAAHEGPQYQLRVTTRSMEMWERSALLWRYPWSELRLIADGLRLRIYHEGREAGTILLEQSGAVHEIRGLATRHGANR